MIRRVRPVPRTRGRLVPLALLAAAALAGGNGPVAAQQAETADEGYARASKGTRRLVSPRAGGIRMKVLLEPANLGSEEVAVAEIVFPPRDEPSPRGHRHGSTEPPEH